MLYKIQHKEKARKTYTLILIGSLYGGRSIMCTATVTQRVLRGHGIMRLTAVIQQAIQYKEFTISEETNYYTAIIRG